MSEPGAARRMAGHTKTKRDGGEMEGKGWKRERGLMGEKRQGLGNPVK